MKFCLIVLEESSFLSTLDKLSATLICGNAHSLPTIRKISFPSQETVPVRVTIFTSIQTIFFYMLYKRFLLPARQPIVILLSHAHLDLCQITSEHAFCNTDWKYRLNSEKDEPALPVKLQIKTNFLLKKTVVIQGGFSSVSQWG